MTFRTKYHRLSIVLFILLLTFSRFQLTSPYSFDGYQIRDLQDATFSSDAGTWSWSSIRTGPVSSCWGENLLGGPCVLGTSGGQSGHWFQKTWTGLPAHNAIRVSFRFWVIDSWDSGDYFQLSFEGVVVGGWSLSHHSSPWQVCGSGQNDFNSLEGGRKIAISP